MSSFVDHPLARACDYDGLRAEDIARRVGVDDVRVFASVDSTLDVAHRIANGGAPAGTLIVADQQRAGRGRQGRSWRSEPGAGVWLTIVERPRDPDALNVLSLRIGLRIAPALDALAGDPVRLKWPNDLYLSAGKLAGVLVEARWREGVPDWVAVGVGINVRVPTDTPGAAGLVAGVSRMDVLAAVVPAIRDAARAVGPLTPGELGAFAARDLAAGRPCVAPVPGTVVGIDSSGSLLVSAGGERVAVRAGSLVLRHTEAS